VLDGNGGILVAAESVLKLDQARPEAAGIVAPEGLVALENVAETSRPTSQPVELLDRRVSSESLPPEANHLAVEALDQGGTGQPCREAAAGWTSAGWTIQFGGES